MPPTRIVKHNGAAIRAIRQIRGYSIAELARRVDVTAQALSNIERENKRSSATLANRIATALSVDLAAIVCNHDEAPRPGTTREPASPHRL